MSRFKKFLGIEGVKAKFDDSTQIDLQHNKVSGQLLVNTIIESKVLSIEIKVIEKYQRGRGDDEITTDYILLNKIINPKNLIVSQDKPLDIPFEYTIQSNTSEMDILENKNKLMKPIIGLAKKLYKVQSNYTITATINVEGSAVKPFAKKILFPVK